ncbi:formylglycine-generating enzyme family protein [candidate division KSB1 bacterium]|nr:formylglycine-generating enzyme family protein [candidate division KSB1 bacterium]
MNLIRIFMLFLILIFNISLGLAQNTAPVVSNVHAEQRANSQKVDVTFDVQDAEAKPLFVTIQVSADGGATYNVPAAHLAENFGYGIMSGNGKRIVWDAGVDYHEQFGSNYKVKVVAIDAPVGKFILVPTDTFSMGSNLSLDSFKPQHKVTISAFYIGVTEITNIEYKQFCDATNRAYPNVEEENTYFIDRPDYPVVNINWFDAIAYCNWRSELEGLTPCYNLSNGACDTTKAGYRLPSEAEWEYAARGKVYGKQFPWGTDDIMPDSCNYQEYSGALNAKMAKFENNHGPLPVASFKQAGFGLYDMAGNVSEWCHDWYDAEYYADSPKKNPMGPASGSDRVCRGGDWYRSAEYLRVFHRDNKKPDSTTRLTYRGFRIIRQAR